MFYHNRKFPVVLHNTLILVTIFLVSSACVSTEKPSWHGIKETIRKKFPEVNQISTTQLSEWLKDTEKMQPVLLDVRESEEFDVSHLKHARFAGSKKAALAALKDKNRDEPVVLYCSVGYRSSQMAEHLQKIGFQNVYNLEGSIFQWSNEGRPVYRNGTIVLQVHPYDSNWGRLLKPELWYKPDN